MPDLIHQDGQDDDSDAEEEGANEEDELENILQQDSDSSVEKMA
jgi:hypothetical protein